LPTFWQSLFLWLVSALLAAKRKNKHNMSFSQTQFAGISMNAKLKLMFVFGGSSRAKCPRRALPVTFCGRFFAFVAPNESFAQCETLRQLKRFYFAFFQTRAFQPQAVKND
jgi:hypothetical protein